MKKKFLAFLSLLIIPSFIAISTVKSTYFDVANASYDTKKVFEDNFDESEISENWITNGEVSFKKHYSSMRLSPKNYDWNSAINLNKELKGDYKIILELSTHKIGGWFSLSLGSPKVGAAFSSSKGGIVFFDNNISEVLDVPIDSLEALGEYHLSPFGENINVKRRVELNIDYIDINHSTLQCEVFENNTSLGFIFDSPYQYGFSLDGYMAFNSNLKEVELYKIEILDSENNRIYYDDFSTSSVLYPSSGSITAEWQSTIFSEEELKVGYINSLLLGDIDSSATYINKLEYVEDSNLAVAYKIETEIQYLAMDYGIVSGVEIGKDNNSEGYYFGLKREVIGYSLIYKYKDNKTELTSMSENSDMTAVLSISIYQNGDVLFRCGELELTVPEVKYAGYVSLFASKYEERITSGEGGSFNYFKIYKDNYSKRDNPDLYMNFNGTKATYFEDIDEYGYDYFISKRDWSMGSNVQLSKWRSKDKGDGKLEFNVANISSFFSPRKVFKDYVVKFDVEITSDMLPHGGTLGLEFGNSQVGLLYENTKSLGIGYYKYEGQYATVPVLKNVDFAPEADTIFTDDYGNAVDLFKDHGKFTLMYVVRNNRVALYYSIGDEANSFGKVRTIAMCDENHSTDGYFAIFGTNNISFNVDNLSVINLDLDVSANEYNGKSDYQEVTRLDFSNSSSILGLSASNTNYVNNKYQISNGGEIKTTKLVNDFIFRSKISDIEKALLIEQDSLKIKLVNGNEKYIEVNDGVNNQIRNLDNKFSFKDSLLEVEKNNTNLVIRFIDGKTPLSEFEGSILSFVITPTNESLLVIKASDGTISLNSFVFINLNKYATITARNYDADVDNFEPWVVRDTEEDANNKGNNKGCSGSFTTQSLIILFVSFMGLVTISIYRRRTQK